MMAEGADFAEVDDGALEAFVANEIGDRIGDAALRDAVERDRHSFARECNRGGAGVDVAEIDERTCGVVSAR